MAIALKVQSLWKSYIAGVQGCSARVWALRGCSLEAAMGERIGIVGGRSSGKTTLLRCLAGHRAPDAGRVETVLSDRCYLASSPDVQGLPTALPTARLLVLLDFASPRHGGAAHDTLLAASRLLAPITGVLIIAGLDVASIAPLVDRIVLLRDGHLTEPARLPVRRVAERPPTSPHVPTFGTRGS